MDITGLLSIHTWILLLYNCFSCSSDCYTSVIFCQSKYSTQDCALMKKSNAEQYYLSLLGPN